MTNCSAIRKIGRPKIDKGDRRIPFGVSLPLSLVERIDEEARNLGKNISELSFAVWTEYFDAKKERSAK